MPDTAFDFQPETQEESPQFDFQEDSAAPVTLNARRGGSQATGIEPSAAPTPSFPSFLDVLSAAHRGGTPEAFTDEPTRSGNPLTGAVNAVRGAGRIIESGAAPPPASRGPAPALPTEPQRRAAMSGTSDVLSGAMQAAAPFVLPESLTAAPVSTLTGLGVGTAAGEAAEYGAKKAGLSPEAQRLAGTAGFFLPSATGALIRPRVGLGITPEEVVLRGQVSPIGMEPMRGEIRIPRGPRAPTEPALEAPTIEGQIVPPTAPPNIPPPTRAEQAEYLDSANFDPQKAQNFTPETKLHKLRRRQPQSNLLLRRRRQGQRAPFQERLPLSHLLHALQMLQRDAT